MSKPKNDAPQSLVDRVLDYEKRRVERSNRLLVIGVASVAALLGVMTLIGLVFAAADAQLLRSTYGDTVAALCDPAPLGTDDLANLPEAAGTRPALLLRTGSQQRHAWNRQLPITWRAETGDDLALVGCVESIETTLETCPYRRISSARNEDFTIRLDRVQHSLNLILVNATTGRRIDSLLLEGGLPEPCPPDSDEITSSGDIDGSEIPFEDVAAWLEPYIFEA